MQEVTVKQRSLFQHLITVEEEGKELCWSFSTRKKNIAFGLFYKSLNQGQAAWTLQENDIPVLNHTKTLSSSSSANDMLEPNPRSNRLSTSSALSAKGELKPSGNIPLSSSFDQAAALSSQVTSLHHDLIPIIQLAQYESSKRTINGSHFIREPGIYALVFDNTYSLQTPKKLLFFVGLKDIDPSKLSSKSHAQGWLLKKANLAVQGYQRRWVQVEASGDMSYSRLPGSQPHGEVNLEDCAVRVDHDNFLIDIDSGKINYHFKAESKQDFDRWVNVIQQFVPQNSNPFPRNPSIEFENNTMLYSSFEAAHTDTETVVLKMGQDLAGVKSLIETLRNKTSKEPQLSAMIANIILEHQSLESKIQGLNYLHGKEMEQMSQKYQHAEAAFYACLNDNNRMRQKYGLDAVADTLFLPTGTGQLRYLDKARMGSMASTRADDVYYDAEEGDFDSTSSSEYSVYEAQETSPTLSEQLSKATSESFPGSLKIPVSKRLSEDMMVSPVTPSVPTQKELSSLQTLKPARRTKLPAMAPSMENFSLMSILRNNVCQLDLGWKGFIQNTNASYFKRAD